MEFGAPENLVFIWLVPLVVLVCFFAEKIRKKRLRLVGLIRTEVLAPKSAPTSFFRWLVKTCMLAGAVACLVLATAKPRWGFEWIDAKQRGADIIIAVDVSKSMLAQDVSPSRLERARRKVSDLLDRMSGDRVGLVAFAGTSFVQCPLTMDYGAVRLFLSYLDPELIPTQGTDLGSAIDMSLAGLFDGAPEGTTTGRAIIIMTDGEDQEGRGLKAAEAAKAKGVKVYTMSIGSEEGTLIPELGGGFKKDRGGNLVISKSNEPALKAIALATGGTHVRSVAGDGDIEALYDNGILKEIDREENQELRTKRWQERFQWFLAAAVLLLFLEPLVRDVRLPRQTVVAKAVKGVHSLGLIMILVFLADNGFAASLSQAHKYYGEKDYEKAAKAFSEVEKEDSDNPEITYNRAVSQYRNGDFAGASEGFGRSAGAKDKSVQEKSWYNLGNSLSYMQKFKEAVEAYENTLKLNPDNVKAKENLELIKKRMEQQKEQNKNPQNGKKDQENKQEHKDQQQQDGQQQDGQPQEGQPKESQDQNQQNTEQQDQQKPGDENKQNQNGEQKPDEKKEGAGRDNNDPKNEQKEGENGKPQDAEDERKSEDKKSAGQKDEQQASSSANHNQEGSQERKQSKTYSTEQAKQLLRSVEDKIKKYRYIEQSGAGQTQDPEKDW